MRSKIGLFFSSKFAQEIKNQDIYESNINNSSKINTMNIQKVPSKKLLNKALNILKDENMIIRPNCINSIVSKIHLSKPDRHENSSYMQELLKQQGDKYNNEFYTNIKKVKEKLHHLKVRGFKASVLARLGREEINNSLEIKQLGIFKTYNMNSEREITPNRRHKRIVIDLTKASLLNN